MPKILSQTNSNKSHFLATNQREFAKLTTFVDFSEGFTIGFIEIDKNQEKNWLVEALIDFFQEKDVYFHTLNFDDRQLQFLLDEISENLKHFDYQENKKLVLIIEGLENSIGIFDKYPAVLQDLNFVRDAFTYNVPYPVLFCLPSYSITRLAKFAPDFWAWKSGVFHFTSIPEDQISFSNLSIEYSQDHKLPGSQSRIDLLNRLYQEYSDRQIEKNLSTLATILQQLGVAYQSRGELEKAEESLKEALNLSEQEESLQSVKATILDELGDVYSQQGKYQQAEDIFQKVLAVYTYEKSSQKWASLQNRLGIVYAKQPTGNIAENLEKAINFFNQALLVYTLENFPTNWATIQNNLANAYLNRIRGDKAENLEMAIAAYTEALKVRTFDTLPEYWASTQNNLATAYLQRIRGDKAENLEIAIYYYQEVLQVYTFDAFPQKWAMMQNNLASAYSERIRGDKDENLEMAISCFQEALKVRTFEDFPQDWAYTQNNLAIAYSKRIRGDKAENLEMAIAGFTEALKIRTFDAFPQQWATTQNNLANAYLNRIRGDKAENIEQAIAYCTEALKVRTFEDFPQDWATTQNNLANAYRDRIRGDKAENLEQAITAYQNALKLYTKEADPLNCLLTANNLGNLHYDKKQWQPATEAYHIAIEALENTRLEALNLQSRQEILSNTISVFHCIIQAHLNLNQPEKALEYIERSKARNLVELMTQKNLKPQGVSQSIIEEYDRLRQQVVNEQIRLQNQNINQNLSRTDNLMPYVQEHSYLKEYQQKLDTFIEQKITPIDPTFKLTQKVKPITFAEIQRLTEPATCLLQWYITSEKILAFIVSSDNKINLWQSTETDLQTFIKTADNYLQLYYSENGKQEWIKQLPNLLQSFSQTLHLSEIINLIPSTCQHLIIIPHRFLHILPIHAFPISENKVLQDKYTIQYAASCQILQQIQQYQQNELTHLLAIQNPTKDLTFTDLEVNIIATLFTQNQIIAKDNATQNTVTAQLKNPNHHCHHFSCHGSFNPNNPLESALILADKEPLTLSEIFELNLKKSRLVVLSACETGMIDLQSLSDEYIGLPSGFLFAGSQNVVSSLWTVNDLSTSFLMMKFYEILLDKTQQVSVPIALKIAQTWLQSLTVKEFQENLASPTFKQALSQLQNTLSLGDYFELEDVITTTQNKYKKLSPDDKPFQNPFYWAAFTATGI